ncbi:MAG: hypothetical protein ACE5RM_03095 [Candidatus Nitrosomaritimum aestuariumsis]
MSNYSYMEIVEEGIEVCASCGSADINFNRNIQDKNKSMDHCFNCDYAEGITTCMPDDLHFYQEAKETLNKLREVQQ